MRFLILGANGRIGSGVFSALSNAFPQDEILAAVRKNHLHFEGCTGKTKHHSIVFDPFGDQWKNIGPIDLIVNCIGAMEETPGFRFAEVHQKPVEQILRFRETLGNPYIIQISALGASAGHPVNFLRTKGIADRLLLHAARTVILRPSIVCAPGTMMVEKLRMLQRLARFTGGYLPVPKGFGENFLQPVLLEDLCEVVVRITKQMSRGEMPEQRIIPLVGPEKIRTRELLLMAVPNLKPVAVSKRFFFFLHRIFGRAAKRLLSPDQYILLSEDNTADETGISALLGRRPAETKPFWQTELFPDKILLKRRREKHAFSIA